MKMEFYNNARRSIIANRNIKKGSIIKEKDLVIKRPNYGIHPSFISIIVGRIATVDIASDEPITWDCI